MPDLLSFSHVLPATLALLICVGAGLGYLLITHRDGAGGGPRLCCAALEHYLDTHAVSGPIEAALRRGEVTVGMTRRQVSLLRGVPRAHASEGGHPVFIYSAKDAETPSWLYVRFEDRRVASARRVPVTAAPV